MEENNQEFNTDAQPITPVSEAEPEKVKDTPPEGDRDAQMTEEIINAVVGKVSEKLESAIKPLKNQTTGLATKIRLLEKQGIPTPTPEVTDDFTYEEEDKKIERLVAEGIKKEKEETSNTYQSQAKEKFIRYAKEQGQDLNDEYSFNEFIEGDIRADNPKERPFLTYRQVGKYYTSPEDAYKDYVEHFNLRFEHKKDIMTENIADDSPSADTSGKEIEETVKLTDEDKEAGQFMKVDEKTLKELKQGKVEEFNV